MTGPAHDGGVLAIVPSATLLGLDGRYIRVEVDCAPGLAGFTIVGLADTALQEARERIRGAIRNAGFVHPPRRITVNLAPATRTETLRRSDGNEHMLDMEEVTGSSPVSPTKHPI